MFLYTQSGSHTHGIPVASYPMVRRSSCYRVHNEIRLACVLRVIEACFSHPIPDETSLVVLYKHSGSVKGIIDHGATDVGSSVVTKASNCNGGHRGVHDRHAGPGLLNEKVVFASGKCTGWT